MDVGQITPDLLRDRFLAGERLTLLDVREEGERAYCAIAAPASVVDLHIPMGQLPGRVEDIPGDGGPLVIYCHHGVRSMVVARWLASRGAAGVLNLEGGIDAWSLRVDRGVPRY